MTQKFLKIVCPGIMVLVLILPTEILATPKTNITWTTEIWPKATEEDGRGAYFDLLNAVYPPSEFELLHSFLPYKRGINFVREGRMDIFSICYPMSEFYRAKHPWAQESLGVLFDEKVIGDWRGLASLENKQVTLHKEIAILPFIKKLNANLIKTDSKAKSLLLLEKRRAIFFLGIYINILHEVDKNSNVSMPPYTFVPLQVITCYPGFTPSPKGERLREMWDKGIERLHKSGELQAIYKKWKLEYPDYQWQ